MKSLSPQLDRRQSSLPCALNRHHCPSQTFAVSIMAQRTWADVVGEAGKQRQVLPSTSSKPATEKVFLVAELFEKILSYAHPETIIPLQRVCKRFRATIQDRPQIQRNLFLKADDSASEVIWRQRIDGVIVFGNAEEHYLKNSNAPDLWLFTPFVFNPLLFAPSPRNSRATLLPYRPCTPEHKVRFNKTRTMTTTEYALLRPRVGHGPGSVKDHWSCRDMFLTQPPITFLLVGLYQSLPKRKSQFHHAVLHAQDGIRFSHLLDVVEESGPSWLECVEFGWRYVTSLEDFSAVMGRARDAEKEDRLVKAAAEEEELRVKEATRAKNAKRKAKRVKKLASAAHIS